MRSAGSAEVERESESIRRHTSQGENEGRLQDDAQPSLKRAKRGKYVSKAW
jgi:hypothetical protein